MPFGWHLTVAMTRSCEKYCQSLRLSSRHWLKVILSSYEAHFHVLGQWFYPTDSEFSDIIVIVIEVQASVARAFILPRNIGSTNRTA
jgi:hypothetical protein